ncbi:hypothetical protein NLI96_g3276 [Meripilus lineatus]|uniref:Het-C-domain-containing protein n=1 Tax=Meripilus lineatus TaxID=2056292 RepID=A0AAD5YKZ5_9APHY|nr:hypothetical protein NLI96_g3276 [Physisporinus lineatus]
MFLKLQGTDANELLVLLIWKDGPSVTEDVLADLLKRSAGGFALGAIIGKGGTKFNGLDVKRVYFGNWLRDYSQAVDVAGLTKLELPTIINLCMVLGFLAHGYATHEFEVTEDRLGVYLPTEHIDNPKGYPDNARTFHPKLRGPVDPQELEIDPRTGMKNYIANENGRWDTSKALVRRTLTECIRLGRKHRAQNMKQDEYEAFRLLGQALHTLEDFPAHSNFCELALVSMGHSNVFVHVGDQVRVQARNGRWVAPIVTGTFGSDDFIHSLLGGEHMSKILNVLFLTIAWLSEATDHLSQASVTDLNAELEKAKAKSSQTRGGSGSSPSDTLRNLLFDLPGGDGSEMAREMESIERIRAEPTRPGGKRPEDMSPQEIHSVLWQVLTFRDSVAKKIEKTIERIPGLGPIIEKLMDSISVFVFTTLEPFLKPVLKTATAGLQQASGEVINQADQYEVFNNPRASDPTHSFLSKDHFNLILNETAGNLSKIIVTHTVNLVVKAWDDPNMNVHSVTEDILQCLFHPDFHDSGSQIQREMMDYMRKWVQGLGSKQHSILNRLSKESVREHRNIRAAGEGGPASTEYSAAQQAGHEAQSDVAGYLNQVPIVGQASSFLNQFGDSGHGGKPSHASTAFNAIGQAQSFFGGNSGSKRDMPSGGPGFPGEGYGRPSSPPRGEASSYYSEHKESRSTYSSDGPGLSMPSFPGGPPSAPNPYGSEPHRSSYAPPPGPPPSFPGSARHEPMRREGYAPSYDAPTFPGADTSASSGYGGYGSYAPEPPLGFPSADSSYAPPPGPPPPRHGTRPDRYGGSGGGFGYGDSYDGQPNW